MRKTRPTFAKVGLGNGKPGTSVPRQFIEIDPDFPPGPANAAWSYIFVDGLPEAEAVLQKAVARKLDFPDLFLLSYYVAFLKGDQAAMERAAAAASDKPGAEDWMLSAQASVSAYSGRLQQSRAMVRRAMDLALQGKQPERAAMYQAGAAVREAFFGNVLEARRNARAALQLSQSRDVEYGAAFALAVAGDTSDPVGVAARMQMAKAYAAMGDQAKAHAAYQNLLDLWKNADEDIPLGKEARAAH